MNISSFDNNNNTFFFSELYLLIESLTSKYVEKCAIYIVTKYFADGTLVYLYQKLPLYNQHLFIKNWRNYWQKRDNIRICIGLTSFC